MAKFGFGKLGAVLLATSIAMSAQAGVEEGVEAWSNGDYARAVAEWQPLADSGDADAQFNLGQAYKLGRGVPQDMARAQQLFGNAARQGHVRAEANYGLMLFQDGNREQAMPFVIRAANGGEPRAQYVYGTALFNGDLAPRDWPRAYAMMTNAAEAGLPQAAASVQQMDRYIPLEQREQGIVLAAEMVETTPVEIASAPPRPAPRPAPVIAAAPEPTPQLAPPPPASAPPPASPPVTRPPVTAPPAPTPAPATQHAAPQPAPAAQTGDWRIQLGSFRERDRAATLWRTLSGRVSQLGGLQPYLVRAGPYTRLQAGPFRTQGEANQACASARRGGSDCISVRRQ